MRKRFNAMTLTIPLPSGCTGCPFAQHAKWFTPDRMVPGSTVLFVLQGPGEQEEKGQQIVRRTWTGKQYYEEHEQVEPQPLLGATGQLFNDRFLPLAGLQRHEVSLANALRCRPGRSLGFKAANDLPPVTSTMKLESSKADIVKALKHCRDTYLKIPPSVTTIVAMGRYAMFALTGIQNEESEYGKKQGVMESWRGYGVDSSAATFSDSRSFRTVDTTKYHPLTSTHRIFFTMHIAALFQGRNKVFYGPTLLDFAKLNQMLKGTWPQPLPRWQNQSPVVWPDYSAFDTEYDPVSYGADTLIRWSLCDTEGHLYCVEAGHTPPHGIPLRSGSTVVLQNALADLQHLSQIVDMSRVQIEDMMLAHSVLRTGEPHNLNHIASKYGTLNRYKHLSQGNPQLYSALDAWEPMQMWRGYFIPSFKKDLLSWKVYRQNRLPLLKVYDKAQRAGSKVNSTRLLEVQQILRDRLEQYQERARFLTGNPAFNLGGRNALVEALYGDPLRDLPE